MELNNSFAMIRVAKSKVLSFFSLPLNQAIFVFPIIILILRMFFSPRRASVFDIVAFILLLFSRFFCKNASRQPIPRFLTVSLLLYMFSDFIAAILSQDSSWELKELRKYIYLFIAGLIFAYPIQGKNRKILFLLFFAAAAIAGIQGIYQYLTLGMPRSEGSLGGPNVYGELLALACGPALIILFAQTEKVDSKTEWFFLLLSVLFMAGGILFSKERGVWIAFVAATIVTLLIYKPKSALIFFLGSLAITSTSFYFSSSLRERATSIVTSVYTEDENGSTGTRFELWKGALLIFRESPVIGVGTGNFESGIRKCVLEKKLKQTPTMAHAHNIFLQALATRGLVGFTILMISFTALLKWGTNKMRDHRGIGGYVIIFTTLFTMLAGLTENCLGFEKYFTALCFTFGLFAISDEKEGESVA